MKSLNHIEISQKHLSYLKILVPIHAFIGWVSCLVFLTILVDRGGNFLYAFVLFISGVSAALIPFVFSKRKAIKIIIFILQLPLVFLAILSFIVAIDLVSRLNSVNISYQIILISCLLYVVIVYFLLLFYLFFGKLQAL